MEHKIGLIGCGTVGQGLLRILHDKKDFLRDTFGFEARVVAISDKIKGHAPPPRRHRHPHGPRRPRSGQGRSPSTPARRPPRSNRSIPWT